MRIVGIDSNQINGRRRSTLHAPNRQKLMGTNNSTLVAQSERSIRPKEISGSARMISQASLAERVMVSNGTQDPYTAIVMKNKANAA